MNFRHNSVLSKIEFVKNKCNGIGETNKTAAVFWSSSVKKIEKVPSCSTSCIFMTMTFE